MIVFVWDKVDTIFQKDTLSISDLVQKFDSTFADHLLEPFCSTNDMEILHNCDKGFRLNFVKSMEIYKQKNCNSNLLNDQTI